ncbi:putative DNA-binding domain-containing protein [Rhodosalinus sp. 5P4]|uniref:HvfC/BufC family peptide modification chaperone n=1 Tax=Rhodosalinus sp. 5P4 TaxID=3239196 RepID=UPI003523E01F
MNRETEFRAALLDPARPAPPGLTDGTGRPAARRFDVYRNNVTASLLEALEVGFPLLAKLLGRAAFRNMALAFLRAHPPEDPRLALYGAALPGFLERFAPLARHGYLPDAARLDLALRRAYHAADAEPIAPDALQALPPDRLMHTRLSLAPAVRVLRSRWPLHAIWAFNMVEGAPKPSPGAQDVLVARPGFDPAPHLLPPGGAAFVAALADGAPFGEAHAAAEAAAPGFDLAATLGLLLGAGAITGLTPPEE